MSVDHYPKSPEYLDLDLGLIIANDQIQPRAALSQETINDYAQHLAAGGQFPPVIVFLDGTDYWLADGFHRLAAAKQVGQRIILAEVRQGNQREATLYAVGANAAHGLKRSNQDKRRAVQILLNDSEWSRWSAREIARACGVSNTFVCNLMRENHLSVNRLQIAPEESHLSVNRLQIQQELTRTPESATECIVQRNGQIYTLNTTNIGRNKAASSSQVQGDSALTQNQALSSPAISVSHSFPDQVDAAVNSELSALQQGNELASSDSEQTNTPGDSPPEPEDTKQFSLSASSESAIQLQLRFDEAKSFFNHFDQMPVWTGEISEVLEVEKDRLRAIVEISLQPT